MRIVKSLSRRLADTTGAITQEYGFLSLIVTALVGVIIKLVNGGLFTELLSKLLDNVVTTIISHIASLLG